jgi:hypothetical protein
VIAEIKKPAMPLTESQIWGDDAPVCVDLSRMTPEEHALYNVWLDKLQLAAGAEEAVRFAHISLRDAREAVQRAQFEFHALVRRNAEAVQECLS